MNRKPFLSTSGAALLLCLGVLSAVAPAQLIPPADKFEWTPWRGPEQNGISRETGLVDDLDFSGAAGGTLLWKSEELSGRSTPIVMNGKLYTLTRTYPGTPREGEQVICADAKTGEILWRNQFNVFLSDVPDTRVGWSCVVGDPTTGRVYALGVSGLFQCIDGETGDTLWSRSLVEEYGLITTYGGRTNVPIVFEDLAIISGVIVGWGDTPEWGLMSKPAHRFLGFNKASGELVWLGGTRLIPYDTTYSTPIVSVLDGTAAMVFGSGDGAVWAMQPRTGQAIWNFPFSRRGLYTTPLVDRGVTYMGQAEENLVGTQMGAIVAIDSKGQEIWRENEVMAGRAAPLKIGDRLYVVDLGAKLYIFEAETGKLINRRALGRTMFSSPIYADGKIYLFTTDARGYVLRPSDEGVEIVSTLRMPRVGGESHGSPIVAHGRIYVPTTDFLYCFGDADHEPAAAERPPAPEEAPLEDTQPAIVQVVPAEILMQPGQQQEFRVTLFNKRGQQLDQPAEGQFELVGPGEFSEAGQYTAPGGPQHTAARVTFKQGDLTGTARIRVIPPLPWKFDFESGEVPLTWVGGRVRHVVRNLDGENVMAKVDTIPTRPGEPDTKLGTRSMTAFGSADMSDYTIQADVRGQLKDGRLADFGLVNQRYVLDLQGASQRLQVRSWSAVLRMAKTIPFEWQPDKWYTMKLTTEPDGERLLVRAKIWARGEAEPEEWTIEAVDESPNHSGSPGLFGNTSDAEAYFDNIAVQQN